MKSNYPLGDLKNQKNTTLSKKSSQLEFDFFYSKFPYETTNSLFIAIRLLGTQN